LDDTAMSILYNRADARCNCKASAVRIALAAIVARHRTTAIPGGRMARGQSHRSLSRSRLRSRCDVAVIPIDAVFGAFVERVREGRGRRRSTGRDRDLLCIIIWGRRMAIHKAM
jgi:hypothetical protein